MNDICEDTHNRCLHSHQLKLWAIIVQRFQYVLEISCEIIRPVLTLGSDGGV